MFSSNTHIDSTVRRSKKSYEDELLSYKDLWDEIQIKDKIHVRTADQMIRYKKYISLLVEYISLYE